MRSRDSLDARIIANILVLGGVSSIVFGIVIYAMSELVEVTLLDFLETLAVQQASGTDGEAVFDIGRKIDGQDDLLYWGSAATRPHNMERLRAWPPGSYHDVALDGRKYHLKVEEADGGRRYFLFDVTKVENFELVLVYIIIGSAAVNLVILLLVGYWLSRRVVKPILELAHDISTLPPEFGRTRLSGGRRNNEVGVIADAFDNYRSRLDDFIERERSFTATASHELRTPLAVVKTSVELIEAAGNLPAPVAAAVGRIKRNAQDMSRLISIFLYLAHETDIGKKGQSDIDLSLILNQVIRDFTDAFAKPGVELAAGGIQPTVVHANEDCARIILNNLLHNAVTYTDSGRISVALENNRLTVRDTGAGMDARQLERVFERNYKGKSSTGLGLGLYIVKRLCRLYRWDVRIDSEPGRGTTVSIDFCPAAPYSGQP